MKSILFAAVATLALGAATARADDVKELKQTARAVAKKSAKACVTVRLVVSITIGDREPQEQRFEVSGTVIDESGLTVLPASALDPVAALGGFGGRGGRRGGGGGQFQIDSEVSSVAIVTEDGEEHSAEVVLKDAEMDLAFLKPQGGGTYDFVDLKAGEKTAEVLEDVFVVGRLGRAANHAVSVATGRVRAVVKGTKGFYVCDNEVSAGSLGSVAYAADGTPLGVFATRTARPDANAQPGLGGAMRGRGDAAIVLRPVADVLDLARQAKAKKVEKKTEKKPEGDKKPEEKKPAKPSEKKGDDF